MNRSFQQRILEAAHKVFIENGYRQSDMRSIAREAGIAVGTIYNYYPNKAVLYQEILTGQWSELEQAIFRMTCDRELEPLLRLHNITDCLLKFVSQHSSFWREIMEDSKREAELPDEGHRAQIQAFEQLKKHLRRLFSEMVTDDSAWIERHVLTYIAAVTHIGVFFPDQLDMNREYVTELVQHIVQLTEKKNCDTI
ncbi:TetR/AcrR family transcriptional regulator [Aneurinibacillus thermoaerophilus]|uniref:TetR/AcrR family transcriptional regulator n=1 Tax=Aneurinibacillus thermoaerophilus TaxID=143495 RepID=UPI002E1B06C1|nr:TetR/AcrR family transcriptional regulator [Aneurinibacillus thermoaerophilus]